MPGMIFHMMVYAGTGNKPILAVLNDAIGITGCLRWDQTHDREVFRQFSSYLVEKEAGDIYRGIENHLRVDEAMHGPKSPVYACMMGVEEKLRKEASLDTSGEIYARMAEFIVEIGLDGVVKENNQGLFDIVEESQKELDLERVSRLFAGFYRIEERKLREGLEFLKEVDFREVACIDGLAEAWFITYEAAMTNLSEFESPEVFKPWYDYLYRCFTDPERMDRLRKLEKGIKQELVKIYELSNKLDFGDS
ncbi:hypothetical protein ACFLW2_03730 [Chloroflexota bacterium]